MKKWKIFSQDKIAVLSLFFLIVITTISIFAPAFTTYSYDQQNIEQRLETPTMNHLMGTDSLGRDLYSRIVYGARMSLAVGLVTALFALTFGTITGCIAGYAGGRTDQFIMRVADIFYIFPYLLLAILFTLLFGRGLLGIFLALGASTWVLQARLVRGLVLQAKEMSYVESAHSIGASHYKVIIKHILPNLMGPIIVSLTFQIPTNIMAESFLSFIGLGLQPPYSSWGTLANEGFRAMRSYPHLILFPGTILFITLLAFNYLGDGLRDLLDPKRKENIDN